MSGGAAVPGTIAGGDPGARPARAPDTGAPAARGARPRLRWGPPSGRELLAGVTVVAVLYAILVVFTSDVAEPARAGSAEPLARTAAAPQGRPAVAWTDVPIAARPDDLGPALASPVTEALAAARPKLDSCVSLRLRGGASAAAAAASRAPPEVVLSLATRGGAVHVDAVDVRTPGAAPELADCARRILDGAAYPAPAAPPGRRHRLAVALR